MKKLIILFLLICLFGCSKIVEPTDKKEIFARMLLSVDCSNLAENIGFCDYVFVGTVKDIKQNVLTDDIDHSYYFIHVDQNLKNELVEDIEVSKWGGVDRKGTMLLVECETLDGKTIVDSELPLKNKQYIFLATAQNDGSLVLSEILDNREVTSELIKEYQDNIENEIEYKRERFKSKYEK